MDFNDHSTLRGSHAFLSPSNPHWQNYDEQKLRASYTARQAARRGTRIHDWAHEGIRLGMRQQLDGNHIERYINDGIGYRMMTEFMIFYSPFAYGEADTLSYRPENGRKTLRIHDLKTGLIKAGLRQLETYAAYFYLEYNLKPEDHDTIVQIYQNDQIFGGLADPKLIKEIMAKTKKQDRLVQKFQKEEE